MLHPIFGVRPRGTDLPSQVEAEAGTRKTPHLWSAERCSQAIAALETLVQVVNTQTGAVATGTTVIPNDDTIPQNDEGDEYMTLAITPKNANNILVIEVVWIGANSNAEAQMQAAIFQDTTADALATAIGAKDSVNNGSSNISFTHKMTAGTTSPTTFKIRAGSGGAGTTTFNGASGARKFGGVMASSITIREYLP